MRGVVEGAVRRVGKDFEGGVQSVQKSRLSYKDITWTPDVSSSNGQNKSFICHNDLHDF